MALVDLPNPKWSAEVDQVITLEDFRKIEAAILEVPGLSAKTPSLTWVDATAVKVAASANSPAKVMMIGFPNILHPGQFILGASDAKYRSITSQVQVDFDTPATLWGVEKELQWWAVYAVAGGADAFFTLKAMPWMRVKSQLGQVISLGTLITPATGIGYGFTADDLAGALIYLLSGSSKGQLRTISANNNDATTGGTITYSGDPLSVAEGDWFIVLPNTNFRFLGSIFNDDFGAVGDLVEFTQVGGAFYWRVPLSIPFGNGDLHENIRLGCPLAAAAWVYLDAYDDDPPHVFSNQQVWITGPNAVTELPQYLGAVTVAWVDPNYITTITPGPTARTYVSLCQYRGRDGATADYDPARVTLKACGFEYHPGIL